MESVAWPYLSIPKFPYTFPAYPVALEIWGQQPVTDASAVMNSIEGKIVNELIYSVYIYLFV